MPNSTVVQPMHSMLNGLPPSRPPSIFVPQFVFNKKTNNWNNSNSLPQSQFTLYTMTCEGAAMAAARAAEAGYHVR